MSSPLDDPEVAAVSQQMQREHRIAVAVILVGGILAIAGAIWLARNTKGSPAGKGTITIRTKDASGNPVPNITVAIAQDPIQVGAPDAIRIEGVTDANGVYVFTDVEYAIWNTGYYSPNGTGIAGGMGNVMVLANSPNPVVDFVIT